MQPVTISRLHAPSVLWRAISRMASIDSCFAESMKAHVFTTSTSAVAASCVSSCPACSANPSITSESTRFFGHPSEIRPTFIAYSPAWTQRTLRTTETYFFFLGPDLCVLRVLRGDSSVKPCGISSWVQAVQHPRIGNRLAHVIELADPGHDA